MDDKTNLLSKINSLVDKAIDNLRGHYQGMAKDDIYMIENLLTNTDLIDSNKKEEYFEIIKETYNLIFDDNFQKAIYKIDEIKRLSVYS